MWLNRSRGAQTTKSSQAPRGRQRVRLPQETVRPPPPVRPRFPRHFPVPVEHRPGPSAGGDRPAPKVPRPTGPHVAPDLTRGLRPGEVAPLCDRRPGTDRPRLLRAVYALGVVRGPAGRRRLARVQPALRRPRDLPDPQGTLARAAGRGLPATSGPGGRRVRAWSSARPSWRNC